LYRAATAYRRPEGQNRLCRLDFRRDGFRRGRGSGGRRNGGFGRARRGRYRWDDLDRFSLDRRGLGRLDGESFLGLFLRGNRCGFGDRGARFARIRLTLRVTLPESHSEPFGHFDFDRARMRLLLGDAEIGQQLD
jgi:hypothetical protein